MAVNKYHMGTSCALIIRKYCCQVFAMNLNKSYGLVFGFIHQLQRGFICRLKCWPMVFHLAVFTKLSVVFRWTKQTLGWNNWNVSLRSQKRRLLVPMPRSARSCVILMNRQRLQNQPRGRQIRWGARYASVELPPTNTGKIGSRVVCSLSYVLQALHLVGLLDDFSELLGTRSNTKWILLFQGDCVE